MPKVETLGKSLRFLQDKAGLVPVLWWRNRVTEYHEMILYASKNVIMSVNEFIKDPTYEKFLITILAMRKDLSKKVNLNLEDIKINLKNNITQSNTATKESSQNSNKI